MTIRFDTGRDALHHLSRPQQDDGNMDDLPPSISFSLTSADGNERALHVPVTGPKDFAAAIAILGGRAMLWETAPDEETGDAARQPLGQVSASGGWNGVLETIRRCNEWVYLNGDCWHMALALNRLYGLDIAAVVNHREEGNDASPNPDERRDTIGHVAAVLPDGRFLDIRGISDGEEALCLGTATVPSHSVRPSSREEVLSILDGYAEVTGTAWEDAASYPFAARTEALARLLFEDMITEALEILPPPP